MSLYSTFEYGEGVVYGSEVDFDPSVFFSSIETPARDLVQITLSHELVIDAQYLNPDNYAIIDVDTDIVVRVRDVIQPEKLSTSSRILLITDRHLPGQSLALTLSGVILRDGTEVPETTGYFVSREAKMTSMLSGIPSHFNTSPKTSVLRHILQAISESDDRIGSL